MKKIIPILLLIIAMLLLVGCGGTDTPPSGDPTPPSGDPTPPGGNGDGSTSVTPTTYEVTWIDENGQVITTTTVEENKAPSYTYSVTDTAEWDYTFEGWASTAGGEVISHLPSVTANVSYYAKVSAVKQKYTVTFNSNGGSAVSAQTVEYGAKATAPDAPTYENHKFMGWCYDRNGTSAVDFEKPITESIELYAIWNEVVDVKALLGALLNGYQLNPFGYIPESMKYDFSANLVDSDDIVDSYAQNVNISSITYGHGEQWHMVLNNLKQTNTFFNVLTVVEGLSASSIAAFNNYFDKNPADTAHHEFENGIYNVTINFDGEEIFYVLDYTANLPVFGEQTVQIALSMLADTGEKTVRIQIGDANALSYTILENSYEFAIKYLGVRRAMFSIEQDGDGNVSGKIYEFLTVSAVEVASAAEFYITEDYVSVVGNKASGMIGFSNYICELYDVDSGKLLGYEVEETLSAVTYDTLWFNLNDIAGINSIRYREENGDIEAAFFVNGSGKEWEAKKKLFSRRFDIEFRTQYVYSYDAQTEEYTEHKVSVPMLFVQEECYDTLVDDVEATNDVTVSVLVSSADFEKLLADYEVLIPSFMQTKDEITPDIIINYIGNKLTFGGQN